MNLVLKPITRRKRHRDDLVCIKGRVRDDYTQVIIYPMISQQKGIANFHSS